MARLLIVDDRPRDRDRYRTWLGGFEPLVIDRGAEASERLEDPASQIDLAIVSWEFRGPPTGVELLLRLSAYRSEIPVLVTSEHLDLTVADRAKAMGARDILLKPFDRKRLVFAVMEALRDPIEPALLEPLRQRLVGESRALLTTLEHMARIIEESGNQIVLLIGESGTGKELLARATHDLGAQSEGPWLAINVGAIPSTLVESTLFGHERGSFTDARSQHIGAFEESAGGTLFLDEIGELDPRLQVKLLRVLQERIFRRLGGEKDIVATARLVCATNRDLAAEVEGGRFREDLYQRLSGREIHIPPLRERGEDLWLLIDHFLRRHAPNRCLRLARESRNLLKSFPFPGNVRELEGVVRHCLSECRGEEILPFHLPLDRLRVREAATTPTRAERQFSWPDRLLQLPQKEAMRELEVVFDREYLPQVLKQANHNVTQAAGIAGLDPKTFRKKWKEAGLPKLSSPSRFTGDL